MKIIYIHHGQRLLGNPPTQEDKLTDLGTHDCNLVAELLNGKNKEKIKAIYTSPFYRCSKTAELINKNINVPIINDDRLNEFSSKIETWTNLQERVLNCINDIVEKYEEDDTVICVTSGVNVCAFINKAYNIKPNENTPFIGIISCSPLIFNYKK